jgi:hypothetical protein
VPTCLSIGRERAQVLLQAEQIQRIQSSVDSMETNFDKADHELRSINSVWGQVPPLSLHCVFAFILPPQLGNAIRGAPKKKHDTNASYNKSAFARVAILRPRLASHASAGKSRRNARRWKKNSALRTRKRRRRKRSCRKSTCCPVWPRLGCQWWLSAFMSVCAVLCRLCCARALRDGEAGWRRRV